MGIISKMLDGSAVETSLTGAAIGAGIGEVLDRRAARHEIIHLLRLQIAQGEYYRKMDQAGSGLRQALASLESSSPWPWPWKPPEAVRSLQQVYLNRTRTDTHFRDTDLDLNLRWSRLRRASMKARIMPLHYMPRTIAGDVVGTARMLVHAMDRLEQRLDTGCVRVLQINPQGQDAQKPTVPIDSAEAITGLDRVGLLLAVDAGELTIHREADELCFRRQELASLHGTLHFLEFYSQFPAWLRCLEIRTLGGNRAAWDSVPDWATDDLVGGML